MNGLCTLNFSLQILICVLLCCTGDEPALHILPPPFVYTIIEHNDSLYYSTQSGEVFSCSPKTPNLPPTRLGLRHFLPIRGLGFTKNGALYAASYETGVHRVLSDTLIPLPKMARPAWAMKIDGFDRIWLAGRNGVFKQHGDTLIRFTGLHEAYDVDFYQGKLVAAHRNGVTLYDTATGVADTTFCRDVICWTIDIFDSLLVVGGVEMCAIINGRSANRIRIGPKNNIPWSIARDSCGSLILGTQKGLLRIRSGTHQVQCIGFKGQCIKSVFTDRTGRLWVGRYFEGLISQHYLRRN